MNVPTTPEQILAVIDRYYREDVDAFDAERGQYTPITRRLADELSAHFALDSIEPDRAVPVSFKEGR